MGEKKPFWVPRSKIVSMVELDTYSPLFEMVGETFRRQSIPVDLEIDTEWLAKVSAKVAAWAPF